MLLVGNGSNAYASCGLHHGRYRINVAYYGIIEIQKVEISILGPILGITSCGIFLLGMLFAFLAMVLRILVAIFILM